MPLIIWDQSLETGIKSIDNQHKRWVDYINELHAAMLAGKGWSVVTEVLDKVIDYGNTHFVVEEQMMIDSKYPETEFARHKAAHQKFMERVTALRSGTGGKAGLSVTFDTMDFLRDWLITHIKETDRLYIPYVKKD